MKKQAEELRNLAAELKEAAKNIQQQDMAKVAQDSKELDPKQVLNFLKLFGA